MNAAMYSQAVGAFTRGELDWERDDIRVMLATDGYTPNQSSDTERSDIGRAEVASSGDYKQGGQRLEDRSVAGGGPLETRLMGGSVTWTGFTGEFRYAVVYDADTGALVAYTDLGVQRATNARVSLEFDPVDGVCSFEVVDPLADGKGDRPSP